MQRRRTWERAALIQTPIVQCLYCMFHTVFPVTRESCMPTSTCLILQLSGSCSFFLLVRTVVYQGMGWPTACMVCGACVVKRKCTLGSFSLRPVEVSTDPSACRAGLVAWGRRILMDPQSTTPCNDPFRVISASKFRRNSIQLKGMRK